MRRDKMNPAPSSMDLASVIRGLYGRVARRLDFDPSYVSRVARGERRSEEVEAAIGQEIRRIMKQVGTNHNGHHLNGNHLNGNHLNGNHRDGKSIKTAKKGNKKVVH